MAHAQRTGRLSIIGHERALADGLTKLLHATVRRQHNYTSASDTAYGTRFDVELLVDGQPSGHIARVTVEILPLERTEDHG
jgi:hypothetical protein